MYQYNAQDRSQLESRREIFERQIERNIEGKLSDEDFRPLRLQQGLYIQRQAPMLRIAVPYGMLDAKQLRTLAKVAKEFDKSYCHITTRQNIQLNWVQIQDVPSLLKTLAQANLHSIQTSGNCIRNITSDPFAGVAGDEIFDPRPYCEIIRQWSLGHPEFAFLPRKFKIAISGSKEDRAITQAHDIGLRATLNSQQERGFQVIVGGGLGRTPILGSVLSSFIPEQSILDYLTAIIRVYNLYGRRDNKYKARIKILVKSIGIEQFKQQVEQELVHIRPHSQQLSVENITAMMAHFPSPAYRQFDQTQLAQLQATHTEDPAFLHWFNRNTKKHKVHGYRIVTLSLKNAKAAPGDVRSEQLEVIADLAERFSFGEVRTTHQQNIVLADVPVIDLFDLWQNLQISDLAAPNIGTINDIICCPGLAFCSLANAESIPVALKIQKTFDDLDYAYELGDLSLNISGCMNACSHHHLANIGILGVDKKGQQFYQISLGGAKGTPTQLGKILGPSFAASAVPGIIEIIIQTYLRHRQGLERFIDTYARIGIATFKEAVYEPVN